MAGPRCPQESEDLASAATRYTTPMFHAKVSDGGLGIPLLGARVRVMKKDRLDNLFRRADTGDDRVLHW